MKFPRPPRFVAVVYAVVLPAVFILIFGALYIELGIDFYHPNYGTRRTYVALAVMTGLLLLEFILIWRHKTRNKR